MTRCASCGGETIADIGLCGTCGASMAPPILIDRSRVETSTEASDPWFMKLYSEKMLIALCVLMVIGMATAAAYAFANSGAADVPVTVQTVPIHTSTSSAPKIGAPVPYSYAYLPQVECATSFPKPKEKSLTMPAMIEQNVPVSLANSLTVYTDGLGGIKVLGPRGWSCTALILEDGSSDVDVYPKSERNVASDEFATPLGNLPSGSPDLEIYARQTSDCLSCTESQACPVFASAAHDLAADMDWSCPTQAPAKETLTTLSPSAVEIIDPPGVVGDTYPSGGANAVYAVMTYQHNDVHGSWEDSCLLPADKTNLCVASLNNFFTNYGKI